MSERLKRITSLYGESLKESCKDSPSWKTLTEEEIIERFSSYDPSRNKSATQWLVTTYLNQGFLLEDLSKAYETLLVFSQVKRLLPVDQRSLNKYKTLAGMWKTIEESGLLNSSPYWKSQNDFSWVEKMGSSRDNLTSKEEKKAEKEKAYKESHLVYQDGNLEVVVPLTEFAAKWHGKGTRWCTSADKDNAFHEYNQKAPLIIIKEKVEKSEADGTKTSILRKSQLWVTKDDIQFMDASDEEIEKLEEGDARIPILKWATDINGSAIKLLISALYKKDDDFLTEERYLSAVQSDAWVLKYIVDELKTHEMCMAAVQKEGGTLVFVPKELRDREMCLAAVQSDGWALEYVPREHLIWKAGSFPYEICWAAIKQNGMALTYIPANLFMEEGFPIREMSLAAVQQNGRALEYVPKKFLDGKTSSFANGEICLAAVQQNGMALQYVPKEILNSKTEGFTLNGSLPYEICLAAVQQNGRALQHIPEVFLDGINHDLLYELCLAAVKNNGLSLKYVTREVLDRKMYMEAITQNGMMLSYVLRDSKNTQNEDFLRKVCMEAVRQSGDALVFVPEKLRDEEICLAAVKQNRLALVSVPEALRNEMPLPPEPETNQSSQQWDAKILRPLMEIMKKAPSQVDKYSIERQIHNRYYR